MQTKEMGPFLWLLLVWLHLTVSHQDAADKNIIKPHILKAVEEAKKIVDDAYKYSREESLARLRNDTARVADILRLVKQPAGDTRSAVRSADYMDIALQLLREKAPHVHKRSLNATDLLSAEDLATIARLTGCAARRHPVSCKSIMFLSKYRTITGTCNNMKNTRQGASNTPLARWLPPEYDNTVSLPKGWNPSRNHNGFLLPLVREVSNRILRTANKDVENDFAFSHLVTIYGQWTDHDLTFTPSSPSIRSFSNGIDCEQSCDCTNPCFPIGIPKDDPRFKTQDKVKCLPFPRSSPACGTAETGSIFGAVTVREQMNALTAYLDVNQVYGSQDAQASKLRDPISDGGLMRVNDRFRDNGRELLPFTTVQSNMCATRQKITRNNSLQEVPCFIAGDARADENIALTSLHTLMLREHNRLARALKQLNPQWSNERLYQEARKILGAFHQVITYRDYLPHIVGPDIMQKKLSAYPGYSDKVDATIANVFSTAAYRFAHLAIQPFVFRLDENYKEDRRFGSVLLHEVFFTPWRVIFEGGVDPVLRGLIGRPAKLNTQAHMMHDELRDRLFQFTVKVPLDLASLNMQRGRDHGLPGYNSWRRFCGLSEPKNEQQLAVVLNSTTLARQLIKLYGTPANIDVWLGGVAEPFVRQGRVGPLFACLIATQFQRIRQGDRLWWEKRGVFTHTQRLVLSRASMSRIICDNTNIKKVPTNPFLMTPNGPKLISCNGIPTISLSAWIDRATNEDVEIQNDEIQENLANSTQSSAFSVQLGPNLSDLSPVIVFRYAIDNEQQLYSTKMGVFTCDMAGLYQFHFDCGLRLRDVHVDLMRNGELVVPAVVARQGDDFKASGDAVLLLRKGDRVWLEGSKGNQGLHADSLFTGYLLFAV